MMRRSFLLLLCFLGFSALVSAQVVRDRTLIWEDPNPPGTVTKYTLRWGTTTNGPYTTGSVDVVPPATTVTVQLPKGTYFFIVTASNPDSESEPSNEATTTIYDNAMKQINFRIVIPPRP